MAVRGCLLYFAFVGLQLQVSSTSVAGTVPLSCFLQNQNFFNIFSRRAEVTSLTHAASKHPPQFDTIRVKAIDLNKDGWIFNTTNLEYSGLNNAVLEDYGFDFDSNILHLTFHADMMVTCQYRTDGYLFSLPICGTGSCIVYLKNIQFGMIMPFNVVEEYGQEFINLRYYRYFYDVRDDAKITLTNLYFGDKHLSARMHHLMNHNWKFITQRYSPIFIDAAAEYIFHVFRNNMLNMPLKGQLGC